MKHGSDEVKAEIRRLHKWMVIIIGIAILGVIAYFIYQNRPNPAAQKVAVTSAYPYQKAKKSSEKDSIYHLISIKRLNKSIDIPHGVLTFTFNQFQIKYSKNGRTYTSNVWNGYNDLDTARLPKRDYAIFIDDATKPYVYKTYDNHIHKDCYYLHIPPKYAHDGDLIANYDETDKPNYNPLKASNPFQHPLTYNKAKVHAGVYKLLSIKLKDYYTNNYSTANGKVGMNSLNRYEFTYRKNGNVQVKRAASISKHEKYLPHTDTIIIIHDNTTPYVYVKRAKNYTWYYLHIPRIYTEQIGKNLMVFSKK